MEGRIRICASVGEKNESLAVEKARRVAPIADVIEIRLDYMAVPDVSGVIGKVEADLLFTNRPVWEGGRFDGEEKKRIEPLLEAGERGAAYVDLEINAPETSRRVLVDKVKESRTKLVFSFHDYLFDNHA